MIFAAGLGTRLKPITDRIPKALLPIGGKTLIEWQLDKLREVGVREVVVNVHHFADQIIDYIQAHDGMGMQVRFSDEREMLLETGGGLRKAWNEGLLREEEDVLVCNVDILSNIAIADIPAHTEGDELGTLVVSERETQRYLLFDQEGVLRGWTNKATGEYRPAAIASEAEALKPLAFSGMQILSPKTRKAMEEVAKVKGDKFSLIDLYLHIAGSGEGQLKAYVPSQYRMMDIGKIDHLQEAEEFAKGLF